MNLVAGFFMMALMGVTQAKAANINVQLEVSESDITLNDSINVQVRVEGTQSGSEPTIAGAENFDVQGGGTSTQFQMINGRTSSAKTFSYSLFPKKAGTFIFGPATVEVDGKKYSSQSVQIKVNAGTTGTNSGGKATVPKEATPFYITAEIDQKNPYVNQQVVYTFRFYRRADVVNAQLGLPDFQDFLRQDLEKQKQFEKNINGVMWVVTEIRHALFPTHEGQITIAPATLDVTAVFRERRERSFFDDPFFWGGGQTRQLRLRSDPVVLNVRPLPEAGKDKNFSGMVGALKISADIGKKQIVQGDSVTLTITVKGDANLEGFSLPELSFPDVKVYDDKTQFNTEPAGGRLVGTKIFKKALVPSVAGEVKIPAIIIPVFNPEKNQYETLRTAEMSLKVAPGNGNEKMTHVSAADLEDKSKRRIEIVGQDIMPIKRNLEALEDARPPQWLKWSLPLVLLLMLGAHIAAWLLRRRARLIDKDAGFLKREKAFRNFNKAMKNLTAGDPEIYARASNLLRSYLGDRLGFDGKALSALDVERRLGRTTVQAQTAGMIKQILQSCETGQYGNVAVSAEKSRQLIDQVKNVVAKVEKEVR